MIWFFTRDNDKRSLEARHATDGSGFELVIKDGAERVERFAQLPDLLSREHELLTAWRAQGWREVGQ